MDYYKYTEWLLYNYIVICISIQNMEKDIKSIKEDSGIRGVSLDSNAGGGEKSSITESTAINNVEKIGVLEKKIERNKRDIDRVDTAMEGLNPLERRIIEKKYIDGLPWYEVAYAVSYSERQCRNIRKVAIEKLIVAMFGEYGE